MVNERHLSHRRRILLLAAFLMTAMTAFTLRHPSPRTPIAWSLGLTAVFLAAASLSGRARWASPAFHGAAIATGMASALIVHGTGGSAGPRFGFLLALPPLVLVAVPELPWASALAGVASIAGGVVVVSADARGGWFLAEWLALALSVLAVTIAGASAFRTLWYEQLLTEQRCSRALVQLAESERLRTRAERVGLVAKLAARLAHEIGNPLAVVKANVAALAAPADPADAPRVELLGELACGVERMSAIAAELRALATVSPGDPARCPVQVVIEEARSRIDPPTQARVTVHPSPALEAVVDATLLAHCVRHLMLGGAALAPERLCVGAAQRDGELRIELGECAAPAGAPLADWGAPGAQCGPSGLHLALADELARTLGGTLGAERSPDGAQRLVLCVPAAEPRSAWDARALAAASGGRAPAA